MTPTSLCKYNSPKNTGQENSREQQNYGKKLCYNWADNYYAGHLNNCKLKLRKNLALNVENKITLLLRVVIVKLIGNNIHDGKGENI